MNLQEIQFNELKNQFSNFTTKILLFIIMMANEELMERCDRNTLESKQ